VFFDDVLNTLTEEDANELAEQVWFFDKDKLIRDLLNLI